MSEDSTSPVKPLSRRLRFEVLRRDDYTCRYCGGTAPDVTLTVDHVVPRALGGPDEPTNLVTACRECNSGKSSTSPDERVVADVADLALRMAKAIEQAGVIRSADLMRRGSAIHDFDLAWLNWNFDGDPSKTIWRPDDWAKSIGTFIDHGLGQPGDLAHFVLIAMESNASRYDKWRYFCGCCWKEITKRQELAQAILSATPTTPPDDAALVELDWEPEPFDATRKPAMPVEWWTDPDCVGCDGSGRIPDDDNDGDYRCWCVRCTPYDRMVGEY